MKYEIEVFRNRYEKNIACVCRNDEQFDSISLRTRRKKIYITHETLYSAFKRIFRRVIRHNRLLRPIEGGGYTHTRVINSKRDPTRTVLHTLLYIVVVYRCRSTNTTYAKSIRTPFRISITNTKRLR